MIILNVIVIATCIGVMAVVLAARHRYFDIVASFVPQISIVAFASILILVMQENYIAAAVLLSVTMYISWPLMQLYFPVLSSANAPPGKIISILHANVNSKNTKPDALLRVIRETKPTIISLNEVRGDYIKTIRESLASEYPHAVESPDDKYQGMAVFSKLPILSFEKTHLSEETTPVLRLEFGDPQIIMYAVHTLPPTSDSWYRGRSAMLKYLGEKIQVLSGPVILAGDLNVTIHNQIFQDFIKRSGLQDSRRGYGWQPSWLRLTPIATAIDHILYKGRISVQKFKILKSIHSDHRPVLVQFSIE